MHLGHGVVEPGMAVAGFKSPGTHCSQGVDTHRPGLCGLGPYLACPPVVRQPGSGGSPLFQVQQRCWGHAPPQVPDICGSPSGLSPPGAIH